MRSWFTKMKNENIKQLHIPVFTSENKKQCFVIFTEISYNHVRFINRLMKLVELLMRKPFLENGSRIDSSGERIQNNNGCFYDGIPRTFF